MMRLVLAIFIGVLTLNVAATLGPLALGLFNVTGSESQISALFLSNLLGGLVAGAITRQHGVIIGAIISLVSFLFLIGLLAYVAYDVSHLIIFPPLSDLRNEMVAVIFGPIGGYMGERLMKGKS
jgi:hypothetical protein